MLVKIIMKLIFWGVLEAKEKLIVGPNWGSSPDSSETLSLLLEGIHEPYENILFPRPWDFY